MKIVNILVGKDYKPGDPPPKGYLGWHEWAEIQHRAGLRQQQCGICYKWKFPQELSTKKLKSKAYTSKGREVTETNPVCKKCQKLKDK